MSAAQILDRIIEKKKLDNATIIFNDLCTLMNQLSSDAAREAMKTYLADYVHSECTFNIRDVEIQRRICARFNDLHEPRFREHFIMNLQCPRKVRS